jgi:Na+-translocating ferredoxin:NAD+ oxidoreductase RnfD subunit
MYFFSITLVAGSAALCCSVRRLVLGRDGVPISSIRRFDAVFLGLHLLVTDPSTSPRTPPGKLLFGVLYGLGVFVLYSLLGAVGALMSIGDRLSGTASAVGLFIKH